MDKNAGDVCLGININQEHLVAFNCQASSQVDCRRAFRHTTFLIGNGNYHVARLRFTYSDAISLSREERVILRSFANSWRARLRSSGAENLINSSPIFLLLLLFLDIDGTRSGQYLQLSMKEEALSSTNRGKIIF